MEGHDKLFYSDLSPLYEHTKERIVNSRYSTLEDMANAALFFAGDDCPSANGSELKLDGGFLLTYYVRKRNQPPQPLNSPAGR
jgi:NAD(P)-dependent dehydrogenase (short-subunit alcohol dehydrogenase family)